MTSTGRRGFVGIDRHWLTELDPTLIVLMLWLDSHSDEYLQDLHVLRISKEIGWSRNRVIRSLDELVRLGFISTEQVADHASGSRTRITLHQSVWTRDPETCAPQRSTDPDSCAPPRNTAVLHDETQAVLRNGTPTTSNPTIEESTSRSASRATRHLAAVTSTAHPAVIDDTALRLCEQLADSIEQRGSKRPSITEAWLIDMDRLVRIDGRDADEVARVIRWLDEGRDDIASFWAPNIRSPRKLRAKWDLMAEQYTRTKRQAAKGANYGDPSADAGARALRLANRLRQQREDTA